MEPIQGKSLETVEYKLTNKQKKYMPLKRAIDIILSGIAIVLLSPVLGMISLLIKLESAGPVLFKQKRVGEGGKLFEIWKFRSMRSDTPKDMPTHMLSEPDKYITKIGKFIRKTSLDELPQIFNIFCGQMSIIGPRPALWNQYDLIQEREKYGANSIKPGLTGWAQINGRDELEIPIKARFDGEYVKKISFRMDLKCFLGTIGSVLSSDGVVEGGTGEMLEVDDGTKRENKVKKEICTGTAIVVMVGTVGITVLGAVVKSLNIESIMAITISIVFAGIAVAIYNRCQYKEDLYNKFLQTKIQKERESFQKQVEKCCLKQVLITGAGSYIGLSVEKWLMKQPEKYEVTAVDMLSNSWKEIDFSHYDVVYHVAGIAHADVGSITEEQKQLYYKVNTELAIEVAEKAKEAGIKQFIFMSSMIVYSGCKEKVISMNTVPNPLNFYGDSKWQADQKVRAMASESFKVVVLRPPMIYGKGSKGNYPELAKLAVKLPMFPKVRNKRSMLHIDNLCEFVKLMIDNEESGVFFPQNEEYTNTSDMVQMIAAVKGHKILMIPGMNILVKAMFHVPGKIGDLATKAFGDSAYEMSMSEYKENYRVRSLAESILQTEGDN